MNQKNTMPRAQQAPHASESDLIERAYLLAQAARQRYGMSRLELGLLLDTVKEDKLWAGKAATFGEYVDDLRLNRNACRTYMRVARKFMVELGVSESILHQLAACNMSVLERAAEIITAENAEDVISAMLALHQRDALAVLSEIEPSTGRRAKGDDVASLFSRYLALPDDKRIDFLAKLRPMNVPRGELAETGYSTKRFRADQTIGAESH